jgi:hypothetical protein
VRAAPGLSDHSSLFVRASAPVWTRDGCEAVGGWRFGNTISPLRRLLTEGRIPATDWLFFDRFFCLFGPGAHRKCDFFAIPRGASGLLPRDPHNGLEDPMIQSGIIETAGSLSRPTESTTCSPAGPGPLEGARRLGAFGGRRCRQRQPDRPVLI